MGTRSGRPGAYLERPSVTVATGVSAVEGVDKLTFFVPRTGLYRISSVLRTRTAGVGASQATVPRIAYDNGTAITVANMTPFVGASPTVYDLTAAAGTSDRREGVYLAAGGTNIVITLNGSGTFTTPAVIDVYFVIEQI